MQNNCDNIAIIAASRAGNIDIVKSLIAKGADVNTQNHHGHTALSFAYNNYLAP